MLPPQSVTAAYPRKPTRSGGNGPSPCIRPEVAPSHWLDRYTHHASPSIGAARHSSRCWIARGAACRSQCEAAPLSAAYTSFHSISRRSGKSRPPGAGETPPSRRATPIVGADSDCPDRVFDVRLVQPLARHDVQADQRRFVRNDLRARTIALRQCGAPHFEFRRSIDRRTAM